MEFVGPHNSAGMTKARSCSPWGTSDPRKKRRLLWQGPQADSWLEQGLQPRKMTFTKMHCHRDVCLEGGKLTCKTSNIIPFLVPKITRQWLETQPRKAPTSRH